VPSVLGGPAGVRAAILLLRPCRRCDGGAAAEASSCDQPCAYASQSRLRSRGFKCSIARDQSMRAAARFAVWPPAVIANQVGGNSEQIVTAVAFAVEGAEASLVGQREITYCRN